jgi:hypothetical protein
MLSRHVVHLGHKMGFKSGDLEGHGSTLMLFCSRKSIVTRAVCGLALSCWNTPSDGQLRA